MKVCFNPSKTSFEIRTTNLKTLKKPSFIFAIDAPGASKKWSSLKVGEKKIYITDSVSRKQSEKYRFLGGASKKLAYKHSS